jgi:site-specific DNA recombinase
MQIQEAVELFLKGTPLRTICNIFTEKGYVYRGRSKKTHNWDPKRLKYIFESKIYLGYISYGGEWYKAKHEPIYDLETYEQLQKLLKSRKERYAKHTKRCSGQTTYLGGMLFCKQCGARYAKQSGRKWKDLDAPLYYACHSRNKKVPKMIKDPNCMNKNWRMGELDEIVFNEIRKLASDPNYIYDIRKEKAKKSDELNKIEVLKKEIANLNDQISRFMDLYGIGKFTIEQVSQKVDPLNERKKALDQELKNITTTDYQITEEDVTKLTNSFGDILERGDLNEIRLVIESLIYYIELDNDDVYIHWKFA